MDVARALRADTYTRRGWGKRICADAAAVDGARLVLSDGCSSSPDTDLGARLLVRAGGDVSVAHDWTRAIDLPIDALDATCLIADADADGVSVSVAGDGVIAGRRHDGTIDVWRVECPSNAPGYPVLALDPDRLAAWREHFGDARQVHGPDGVADVPGTDPIKRRFAWVEYSLVALFSDGISALDRRVDTDTGRAFEPVPVDEAVAAFLSIPHPRGSFVERRARRLFDRTGWRPRDDFSIGVWAC